MIHTTDMQLGKEDGEHGIQEPNAHFKLGRRTKII